MRKFILYTDGGARGNPGVAPLIRTSLLEQIETDPGKKWIKYAVRHAQGDDGNGIK